MLTTLGGLAAIYHLERDEFLSTETHNLKTKAALD
jgi:hypothetical protein